jgi:hypothetical protein
MNVYKANGTRYMTQQLMRERIDNTSQGPRSLTKFQTESTARFTTHKREGFGLQEAGSFTSVTLLLEGRPGTRTLRSF